MEVPNIKCEEIVIFDCMTKIIEADVAEVEIN